MPRALDIATTATLWIVLGGWIGAMLLFAAVAAPAAFRLLPSSELAGDLVGTLLRVLHLYGIAAGLGLSLLAWMLGRRGSLVLLPLALAAFCAVSEFGVSTAIVATRELAMADPPDPSARRRFELLHGASVGIFAATGLGAVALAALHARADVSARRRTGPEAH